MKEIVAMSLQEVNRAGMLEQIKRGQLSQVEAAQAMGLTNRQVRRLVKKYRAGASGIVHGLRGRTSNHSLDPMVKDEAVALVKTLYSDFKPSFAAEKLAENHLLIISHETLRQLMTDEGLWKPKQRKATHRQWRERKACYGEMEQFDGSYHDWFEGRGPWATLLASRDDANNQVVAQFAAREGTASVMLYWKGYLETYGKPNSIYLDRHSTYKVNSKGALDDPGMLTQFERAMKELGVEVIHAYSPQAKGRIENLFGTLQDRLVKELRLAGISTIAEANQFLVKVFLPEYNRRFCVNPASAANLHWPVSSHEDLEQILSVQSERLVGNDFTVRFKSQWLQLAKAQPTLVLPKYKVTVEERLDSSLHIRLKNTYLNYQTLTRRPAVRPLVVALTKPRVVTRPANDHPWKRSFKEMSTPKPDISTLQRIGHF